MEYALSSRGLAPQPAEFEAAVDRASQRSLKVKILHAEELVSSGPNYQLCNAELECTGSDTYQLSLSGLLLSSDAHIRLEEAINEAAMSEITARAMCWITAAELARAQGMHDRAMKPGDKEWLI